MTTGLQDFYFFLSRTFVYEPSLINISMNTDDMITQIFQSSLKVTKGHLKISDFRS